MYENTGSVQSTQVRVQIEALLSITIELQKLIEELENKLAPVLMESEKTDIAKEPPKIEPRLVPLAEELRTIGGRVSSATSRINFILGRCQL